MISRAGREEGWTEKKRKIQQAIERRGDGWMDGENDIESER